MWLIGCDCQVPYIVRRAYALDVERSAHNLPMSPMEIVVVTDLRFVMTTTGPPVRARFSQIQDVGSKSVGVLVPTVSLLDSLMPAVLIWKSPWALVGPVDQRIDLEHVKVYD